MAERVALALALIAAAVVVAALLRRRRAPAPVRTGYHVPGHVDRREFVRPEASWLVVAFTSSTCAACDEAWTKVGALESDEVAVEKVELSDAPDRHERYGIDAVPTVIVADAGGAVRGSFLGPPPASDLWAVVAEVRDR